MALGFVQPFRQPLCFSRREPYTCGACGIQFQFYNNLLEHMQSHARVRTVRPPPPPSLPDPARGRASLGPRPQVTVTGPEAPVQSFVTQGSVELKKLPEAVASAWNLHGR